MKAKVKKSNRQIPEAGFTPAHIKSILVPVDFSKPSLAALRCAAAFARRFKAKITLLHVIEPMATPDMEYLPMALDMARIDKMARRKLNVLSRPPDKGPALVEHSLVRTGKPFREIVETAKAREVDLIIIATHGYTGLDRALLGSTAERVVRYAPCPVMTLQPQSLL